MSVTNEKRKLVNRLEVKFTNNAIDNFTPSFEFKDEGGACTKDQLTVRLVEVGPTLKGLKLNCYRKKKTKYFNLSYWFEGKSLALPCGLFRKDVYGVEEVEKYLKPIVKACTNEHGHWQKNPKKDLKDKEKIKEAEEKIKT